jgi:hypothetical protein
VFAAVEKLLNHSLSWISCIEKETLYVESVRDCEETLTDIIVLRWGNWMKYELKVYRDLLARAEGKNHFICWKESQRLRYRRKEVLYSANKKISLHDISYSELLRSCKKWISLEHELRAP